MNLDNSRILCALFCCLGLLTAPQSRAAYQESVINTPHNLSVSGGGGINNIKSTVEVRVCIFCHTPHHASADGPLWSRQVPSADTYTTYDSTTLSVIPQPPRLVSRLCLSCHDGTIALGQLGGYQGTTANSDMLPERLSSSFSSYLGTDLSNDHPISFPYPLSNPDLHDTGYLATKGIKLDHAADGDYVECSSCHDPHNNQFGNFMVVNTSINPDALCTACHNIPGWNTADNSHQTGTEGGCMVCHLPHNAPQPVHLLRSSADTALQTMASLSQAVVKFVLQSVVLASKVVAEPPRVSLRGKGRGDCYSCHKQPFSGDVWSQFNATAYNHPIGVSDARRHRSSENLPVSANLKHVVCADCHNPHRAGKRDKTESIPVGHYRTSAPAYPSELVGSLKGVRGIDQTGASVVREAHHEYEICYKCHAGIYADRFTALSDQRPSRIFPAFNQSLRFSPANPSTHPVTADRLGDGKSLVASLQRSMIRITCTDCHHPHGSNEPHILQAQNFDVYPSATADYPLCFNCHSRDYLLNPLVSPHSSSVTLHNTHAGAHHVPCSVCHDPHGVPIARGATASNGAHLINFDTRYAGRSARYDAFARNCTVSCHRTNPRSYLIN